MASKKSSSLNLTARQWNMVLRLVNMKIPKAEVENLTKEEAELYDSSWAEAEAHEKKYGEWPVFEMVEIEWEDPALDIYKDPVE